jgi:hypothetical protein
MHLGWYSRAVESVEIRRQRANAYVTQLAEDVIMKFAPRRSNETALAIKSHDGQRNWPHSVELCPDY